MTTQTIPLDERVARLEAEVATLKNEVASRALVDALAFYADPANWQRSGYVGDPVEPQAHQDAGMRARLALGIGE